MKQLWKDILLGFVVGCLLPGILLNGAVYCLERREEAPRELPAPETIQWPVQVRTGGRTEQMDLEAYLVGVVLAEMPASFEAEALKAQSVAARTYTRKAFATGGKHGDGSVCTESSCCQGYRSEESHLRGGGTETEIQKVAQAVAATRGEVLIYGGELIEATYFSCSAGATEDAAAVWGTDYPYLQSVISPNEPTDHSQRLEFTPEEFQAALGRSLPGSPRDWFSILTYTEGGGVANVIISGESYSGTQLRSLLGLRSTAFTVEADAAAVAITTRGYGHRVGMSQYGAEAMAAQGHSYREILEHYYPGAQLVHPGMEDTKEQHIPE